MAYEKIEWENSPSTKTPLNATNLNHMDDGISNNDSAIAALQQALVTLQQTLQTLQTTIQTLQNTLDNDVPKWETVEETTNQEGED